jgi:hypothetical protein
MKTKLLKKVRKRFSIVHLPNGFVLDGVHFDYNFYRLDDSADVLGTRCKYVKLEQPAGNQGYGCKIFATEKECIDYLKGLIIERLKSEGYTGSKERRLIKSNKKVWYLK